MPTLAPGQCRDGGRSLADVLHQAEDDLDATELMRCLLDTMPSFQNATTATEFFQSAADAMVDSVGLDYAAALTWDGQWHTVATCGSGTATPSARILNEVYSQRCSVRELPANLTASSLDDVKSLVAAPLLDTSGLIVGAVYGDRRYSCHSPSPLISELEAMFVELIASGAANGLARLKQQAAAARERSRFEDFFGPRLAKELEEDPQLLEGRSSDVTVLFCDIRGFSAITDRLDVRTTLDWINDVLELLSSCVHEQDGVVVDYVGDEIMAMWGAPNPCEDHAQRACDAALAIHRRLSEVDQKWESVIGNQTEVSIGINSGEALVGNTGSRSKYKYGPLGTAVNKASRVQGTTKLTQCDIVISNETWKRISPDLPTRRLCQVQVINIPQPVELYELASDPPDGWSDLVETYESALLAFEASDFPKTVEALGHLLVAHPNDGPTMVLLSRAVNAITKKPDESHPVWILDKK
jgi:adenylate cyclase